MKRLLQWIPAALLVLFGFALLMVTVHAQSAFSVGTGGSLNFVAAQQGCGNPGQPQCTCKQETAEAHGDGVSDDGKTTRTDTDVVKDCDNNVSGDESFEEENHRCTAGVPKTLTIVMNAATETGECTAEDGSKAEYTILMVKQATPNPNLWAISWSSPTSSFNAKGLFIDGYVLP